MPQPSLWKQRKDVPQGTAVGFFSGWFYVGKCMADNKDVFTEDCCNITEKSWRARYMYKIGNDRGS